MAVDHYRPKGKLIEVDPPHEGYWWLAFDLNNYRLACTNCNSPSRNAESEVRGKRNYFPILDEATRVRVPVASFSAEVPLLLDPTRAGDAVLLVFDSDGMARPNPILCPAGSVKLQKAETTIDLLNLNQPGIRDRRKRLYRQMLRLRRQAEASFEGFVHEDLRETTLFLDSCEGLKEAVAEFADLASNARSFLRGWRGTAGISQTILDTVI